MYSLPKYRTSNYYFKETILDLISNYIMAIVYLDSKD